MRPSYLCALCCEPIYFDETCYDLEGDIYCEHCMESFKISAPEPCEEYIRPENEEPNRPHRPMNEGRPEAIGSA